MGSFRTSAGVIEHRHREDGSCRSLAGCGSGKHLVQAAAAESLQVDCHVLEAQGAKLSHDGGAEIGLDEAGDHGRRNLDAGNVAVVPHATFGESELPQQVLCARDLR
jgi:hypothetical protein